MPSACNEQTSIREAAFTKESCHVRLVERSEVAPESEPGLQWVVIDYGLNRG